MVDAAAMAAVQVGVMTEAEAAAQAEMRVAEATVQPKAAQAVPALKVFLLGDSKVGKTTLQRSIQRAAAGEVGDGEYSYVGSWAYNYVALLRRAARLSPVLLFEWGCHTEFFLDDPSSVFVLVLDLAQRGTRCCAAHYLHLNLSIFTPSCPIHSTKSRSSFSKPHHSLFVCAR